MVRTRGVISSHPWDGGRELGVEAKVGEKGCSAGGRMNCVVISKFSEWEKCTPIGLLVIDVAAEILLEDRVDPLSLAVSPGVERSG